MGDWRFMDTWVLHSDIIAFWSKVIVRIVPSIIGVRVNISFDVCSFFPPCRTFRQRFGQFISLERSCSKANCVQISKTYSHSYFAMNFGLIILPNKLSLFFEVGHHLSHIVRVIMIRHCHQWHLFPLLSVPILTSSIIWKHSYQLSWSRNTLKCCSVSPRNRPAIASKFAFSKTCSGTNDALDSGAQTFYGHAASPGFDGVTGRKTSEFLSSYVDNADTGFLLENVRPNRFQVLEERSYLIR